MADKTDLNIISTDPNGKKQTTKISYVNPEASATQLYQLATKLMNTSQNTYQESSRVDTTEITDESQLPEMDIGNRERTATFTQIINDTKSGTLFQIVFSGTSFGAGELDISTVSVPEEALPFNCHQSPLTSNMLTFEAAMPEIASSDYGDWATAAGDYVFNVKDKLGRYKTAQIKITITAE